jgi:hypothetical protein
MVPDIKKVMAFPSKKKCGSRLLSTPGAPECHAVPQGTKCGANRAHGHVRELGLEEGRGRGKDPGPGPKAEQRLSRRMALMAGLGNNPVQVLST